MYASCGEAWLDPTSDSSRMQESDDAPRRVSLPDRMVGGGNAWTSSSESEKILKGESNDFTLVVKPTSNHIMLTVCDLI